SPIGKALGGVLKSVAKKALPVVGGALGSMVAPGIGTALGSKLGSMASGLFEVELEAMPAEAAEFEVARRLVNMAASAAQHAAVDTAGTRPPTGVAGVTRAGGTAARLAGAEPHTAGAGPRTAGAGLRTAGMAATARTPAEARPAAGSDGVARSS